MTLACRLGKSILKTRWGCHFKNRSRINWRFASGGGASGGATSVVLVVSLPMVVWCGGVVVLSVVV